MITIEGGNIQDAGGIGIPNGSITLQLNVDATIIADPFGFVVAAKPVTFQFDSTGNLVQPAQIWSNKELNPQNDVGLGTYYRVTLYNANGARMNQTPMWWQFTEADGDTVDISALTPFATVGGNVIFYPTSFAIPDPTPSSLGGIFSNVGVAHEWVSSINEDGTVTLSRPAFTDISGTISAGQLPSSFGATEFTGLITGDAGIQLGVAGTTSGQIVLEGSTSGSASITAPAIAGTAANPLSFSNGINIPSGTAFSINNDTGISRDSAGVLDIGNGTPGDTSGQITVNKINGGGTAITAANASLSFVNDEGGSVDDYWGTGAFVNPNSIFTGGTDMAGSVGIVAGTGASNAYYPTVTVTFNQSFAAPPIIVCSASVSNTSSGLASMDWRVISVSNSSVTFLLDLRGATVVVGNLYRVLWIAIG